MSGLGAMDPNMHLHSSGSVECKLCLSVHANTTAYLSHAQGNLHKKNIAKYTSASSHSPGEGPKHHPQPGGGKPKPGKNPPPPRAPRLPRYNVIKLRDPKSNKLGIRAEFQFDKLNVSPKYRLMSSYEQSVEEVNSQYQYLVVAGEPYSPCAIRLPADPIDRKNLVEYFDSARGKYYVQLMFE